VLHCGFQAIALFNANEHQEALLRIGELAACPNVDPVACRIVEVSTIRSIALGPCAVTYFSRPFVHQAYLHVQLGNIALDGARYNEAVEHFTAAANASTFFYKSPIHLMYDEFVAVR